MNRSGTGGSGQRSRVLNAVPLQNAVLCAECDVVSDSPHATCLVCGSPSLFNIARMFGGKLDCPGGSRSFVMRCRFEIPPASQAPQEGKSRVTGTPGPRTRGE